MAEYSAAKTREGAARESLDTSGSLKGREGVHDVKEWGTQRPALPNNKEQARLPPPGAPCPWRWPGGARATRARCRACWRSGRAGSRDPTARIVPAAPGGARQAGGQGTETNPAHGVDSVGSSKAMQGSTGALPKRVVAQGRHSGYINQLMASVPAIHVVTQLGFRDQGVSCFRGRHSSGTRNRTGSRKLNTHPAHNVDSVGSSKAHPN
jgi:hypothetical protein